MVTPIRITTNNSLLGVGTGKDKGEEVFPTTSYTLRYFKLSDDNLNKLKQQQQKRKLILTLTLYNWSFPAFLLYDL